MHDDSFLREDARENPLSIELEALKLFEEGETDLAWQTVARYLDEQSGELDPGSRSELALLQFEFSGQLPDPERRRDSATRWLESIAELGDAGWLPLLEPDIRAKLDESYVEPADRLEWLELMSFAPAESGLSGEALALIEDFGHQHAPDPALAREAERLLHALGARDAAYRVEHGRRVAHPSGKPAGRRIEEDEVRLSGLTIAIAGGHPALRRAIQNDLKRAGAIEIREIPPRWEASRQGREIVALLAGVDVAVLIGRHIAHSTVDQVKRGASLAGIPVLSSHTASASGVRRALEEHLKSRRLDKPSRPT